MRACPSSRTKPSILACNSATLTRSTSTPSTLTRSFAALSTYLESMLDLPLEVRETRLPGVLLGKSYPGAYSLLCLQFGEPLQNFRETFGALRQVDMLAETFELRQRGRDDGDTSRQALVDLHRRDTQGEVVDLVRNNEGVCTFESRWQLRVRNLTSVIHPWRREEAFLYPSHPANQPHVEPSLPEVIEDLEIHPLLAQVPEEADGADPNSRTCGLLQRREAIVIDSLPPQERVRPHRSHLLHQIGRRAGDEVRFSEEFAFGEGYVARYSGETLIVVRAVVERQAWLQSRKKV